jgi:hypothetical protein
VFALALPETAGAPDREAEREGGAGREQDRCKRGPIGLHAAGDEHGRNADQADETALDRVRDLGTGVVAGDGPFGDVRMVRPIHTAIEGQMIASPITAGRPQT